MSSWVPTTGENDALEMWSGRPSVSFSEVRVLEGREAAAS